MSEPRPAKAIDLYSLLSRAQQAGDDFERSEKHLGRSIQHFDRIKDLLLTGIRSDFLSQRRRVRPSDAALSLSKSLAEIRLQSLGRI